MVPENRNGIQTNKIKTYVPTDLYVNVPSNFTHNSPHWKQPKYPSTGKWMRGDPSTPGTLGSNRQEQTTGTRDNKGDSQSTGLGEGTWHRGYTLCLFIRNSRRSKAIVIESKSNIARDQGPVTRELSRAMETVSHDCVDGYTQHTRVKAQRMVYLEHPWWRSG